MWKAGEVGVCIDDPVGKNVPDFVRNSLGEPVPEVGKMYRVIAVGVCEGCNREGLQVFAAGRFWHSECFRKMQRCEDEFIQLMKRVKPAPSRIKESEDA